MKILLTGGTGFIGNYLNNNFIKDGHDVTVVTRNKINTSHNCITWEELASSIEKFDVIINLAGENISSRRWSNKQKNKILQSRITTTEQIISYIKYAKTKPTLFINGSAIGIYGTSETEIFDEESYTQTNDFLAYTVSKWEDTAIKANDYGVRTAFARFGVVIDPSGGALKKMLLPYYFYVGGKIGSGNQILSWITLPDIYRLMLFIIENPSIKGAVNFTAPNPVTMNEMSKLLAKTLNKPNFFPVPTIIISSIFGEMSMVLLEGQNVIPKKALHSHFTFKYPTLEKALHDLL